VQKTIHSPQQLQLQILLRQIRQKNNLTQVGLAERLQVRQAWVSSYERGERRLDILELRQVCNAMGIPFLAFMEQLEGILNNGKDSHATS
jgi:transcriptional regulator with XRE-family HTH domain